jgi:nicotinate-nucleotide adenylyltransferase
MPRIAFFGGSFDPPHRGHLAIARAAADRYALDQVLFAPVAHQPLKGHNWKLGHAATPFEHRYAMTVLATQDDPRFIPSLLDAPRGPDWRQPNYTLDTLHRLHVFWTESNIAVTLFTLIGADSWLEIARWHGATELLAMCDWIVAARPGFPLDRAAHVLPPRVTADLVNKSADRGLLLHHSDGTTTFVHFLPYTHEDVAATDLRVEISSGKFDPDVLPPGVWDYIRKTQIYAPHPSEPVPTHEKHAKK